MSPKRGSNPKHKKSKDLFIVEEEEVNSIQGEIQGERGSMDDWVLSREEKDEMFAQSMLKFM